MNSQFEEEKHILKAFGSHVGRFLDIGCWDPITFSNSRALVERGWSGVMIEPAPGPFIELLRCCTRCGESVDDRKREVYGERKQRECSKCGGLRYGFDPRFTLIHAAVALEPGLIEMSVTDDALSTSDEASRAKWDAVGGFYGKMLAPVITLDQIAQRFGGFDFVNLDVEGQSAELCLQMFRLGWQPTVICVESDGRDNEIIAKASPLHYHVVYGNGQNLVMVRA
jgi:FkbM family methyltransferase